jgi:hypothetical protein
MRGHLTDAGAAIIDARRQPRNRSMDAGTYRAGQGRPSASSGVCGFSIAPHSMPTWPSPDGDTCAGTPTDLPAAVLRWASAEPANVPRAKLVAAVTARIRFLIVSLLP